MVDYDTRSTSSSDDFSITHDGGITLLHVLSNRAAEWIDKHLVLGEMWGRSIMLVGRIATDVAKTLENQGFIQYIEPGE